MPFLTRINGATINLNAQTPVVTLPATGVLNSFGTSTEITSYNVLNDADPATTQTGEFLAPVVGGQPLPGTYQGGVTFSNLALRLGPVLGTRVLINVNPIAGNYFVDENGGVYLITENRLDAANLTASATIDLPLGPDVSLPNVSLTALIANPLIQPLLPANGLLNAVIVTQQADPTADLIIEPGDIGDIVCFVAGTMILTPQGYHPIEKLQVGDLVCTKDSGNKPIQWIGSRKLDAGYLKEHQNFYPIRISKGALGDGVPSSDLLVSPQHRVLVRSNISQKMFGTIEILVAAKQLLQVDGIDVAADMEEVDYFHMLFDQHEVVISNGAETESLFTGPEAIKSVGAAARAEIFTLFPKLRDGDYIAAPARLLASGRMARRLAVRHVKNRKALVQ